MKPEDTRHILGAAKEVCLQQQGRLTEKRKRVLAILLDSDHPISAYQICDLYSATHAKNISVMSVYRMLKFLQEMHLVHRLDTTNQYIPCAHINAEEFHEHRSAQLQFLICDQCNHVDEVSLGETTIKNLTLDLENCGFTMEEKQLEIHGTCGTCSKTQQTQ